MPPVEGEKGENGQSDDDLNNSPFTDEIGDDTQKDRATGEYDLK